MDQCESQKLLAMFEAFFFFKFSCIYHQFATFRLRTVRRVTETQLKLQTLKEVDEKYGTCL